MPGREFSPESCAPSNGKARWLPRLAHPKNDLGTYLTFHFALCYLGAGLTDVAEHRTSPLTAREREIASLIRLGLTNRHIANKLYISERTVDSHVQNILNKLGATNRAQIAAWSTETLLTSGRLRSAAQGNVPAESQRRIAPSAARAVASRPGLAALAGVLLAVALVVAATDDGIRETTASVALPPFVGALTYEAKLTGRSDGFGTRSFVGDPSASYIHFVNGAVEFAVTKPGGNTGTKVVMPPRDRYYVEVRLSVVPGSKVEFLINLGSNGSAGLGDHVISFDTASERLRLQYMVQSGVGEPLSPDVPVAGLQSGRTFVIAADVDPPLYQVYLDGIRVISLRHAPNADLQSVSFAILGSGGSGKVRLTALRVYRLTYG